MVPRGSLALGVAVLIAGVAGIRTELRVSPPAPARAEEPLAATGPGPTPTRCPAPPGETIEPGYTGVDSALLLANRSAVESYSRAYVAQFGGYQFTAGPPSKLRVAFTADVDRHLAALGASVPFPDRLEVIRADHSLPDLEKVKDRLAVDLARPERAGAFSSLALGWQAVDVALHAGLEPLAADYASRFGNAVRITIAGQHYAPTGCAGAAAPVRCADLAGAEPASAKVTLGIVADTPTIAPQDAGEARLVIHNLGTRRFTVDTGMPIAGSLVLPGTPTVVGRWTGITAGVGGGVDLEPGEAGEIAVVFGASRCDGQPGSALPAGRYGLRAVLTPVGGGEPRLLSPETIVTVTANPV